MPGRGPQTFKKRQKEQQRKERQMEKMAKRLQRKDAPRSSEEDETLTGETGSELTPHDPALETPANNNAHE